MDIPWTEYDAGMTTANMKFIAVGVTFDGELESPEQRLDEGEHIVKRIVELAKLNEVLKGELQPSLSYSVPLTLQLCIYKRLRAKSRSCCISSATSV